MLHAWSPISRGVPSYWLSSLGRCHPSLSGFMEHIGCSDRDAACWLGFGCDWSYNFNAVNASPDNPFFFFHFQKVPRLLICSQAEILSPLSFTAAAKYYAICFKSRLCGFLSRFSLFFFFFSPYYPRPFSNFPFLFFSLRLFAFTFSCRFCPTVIDFRHHFYSSSMPGFPQVDMHSWCQYFNILQAHPKGRHRSFPWD